MTPRGESKAPSTKAASAVAHSPTLTLSGELGVSTPPYLRGNGAPRSRSCAPLNKGRASCSQGPLSQRKVDRVIPALLSGLRQALLCPLLIGSATLCILFTSLLQPRSRCPRFSATKAHGVLWAQSPFPSPVHPSPSAQGSHP